MKMDWKLNNELIEVWHSSFRLIFLLWHPRNRNFCSEKIASDFCQKFEIQILSKNATFLFSFSIVV